MIRSPLLINVPILIFALIVCAPAYAQTSPVLPIDPALSQIAIRVAGELHKIHVTKVIFADLKGPGGETHPAGRWLADQLALACQKNSPDLAVIIRPAGESTALAADGSDFRTNPAESIEDWAHRMGASVFVSGTFAKLTDGIGVTVVARTAEERPRYIAEVTGVLPVSDTINSLSQQPLPEFRGDAPRAGVLGYGIPQCIYCPSPRYTGDARNERIEGSTVLEVTVTSEGQATNIKIIRDPGHGLGMKAVEAVRNWKFKPAVGPMGQPVPVVVPIQVTFRLGVG